MGDSLEPFSTTGTILKLQPESQDGLSSTTRYFVCLTPACDALRLKKERAFSFVEAFKSKESYNIVVKGENSEDLYLKFDTKLPEIYTFKFRPSTSTRRATSVAIKTAGKTIFQFSTIDNENFVWLGELRYSRVISEIGKITGTWMRIGVIDSEYLRIMSK